MKRWKELEKAVADLFDLLGFYYIHIENYRCFKCGQVQNSKASNFPDFHVPSLSLYVECKTGKGKLTPGQEIAREAIERGGGKYLVVRENVDTLLQFLRLEGYIIT